MHFIGDWVKPLTYIYTTSLGETNILIFQSGLFSQRYIYLFDLFAKLNLPAKCFQLQMQKGIALKQ